MIAFSLLDCLVVKATCSVRASDHGYAKDAEKAAAKATGRVCASTRDKSCVRVRPA